MNIWLSPQADTPAPGADLAPTSRAAAPLGHDAPLLTTLARAGKCKWCGKGTVLSTL